jgi:hypothetical protein
MHDSLLNAKFDARQPIMMHDSLLNLDTLYKHVACQLLTSLEMPIFKKTAGYNIIILSGDLC